MRFSCCDEREAARNIGAACDAMDVLYTTRSLKKEQPEVSYTYHSEDGKIAFVIHRYPHKRFAVSHCDESGNSVWSLKGIRPVLFRLPSVIGARTVVIVEGEKDALRMSELPLRDSGGEPVAVTTNPFGAGKWKDEYSAYLKGKDVIIIPDSDEAGETHGEQVEASVKPYAKSVEQVFLPAGAKDVSEYLESHSIHELIQIIGSDLLRTGLSDNQEAVTI